MNYKVFGDEYNKHNPPINDQHRKSQYPVPVEKPKPLTIADILPNFDRWSIGYTSAFEELQQLAKAAKSSSYPPYNITKFDGGKFMVQIALAGFRKEDITISLEDRTLTVASEVVENDNPSYGKVIHHGIAQRDFKQQFALAEYVEVEDAKMEDGILTINLVTNIPEEKKPKIIDIQ